MNGSFERYKLALLEAHRLYLRILHTNLCLIQCLTFNVQRLSFIQISISAFVSVYLLYFSLGSFKRVILVSFSFSKLVPDSDAPHSTYMLR